MNKKLLPLLAITCVSSSYGAILAEWDTTGYLGTETSISVANVSTGLSSVSSIGFGSELLTTAGGGGMNTTSWSTALNGASGNYYGFSVTVAAGYELNLTSFLFTARSSNTGPGNFALRYSGDSFASDLDAFSTTNDLYGDVSLDLSSLGTLTEGTYEFRIGLLDTIQSDGVGDVTAGGTHRIMNPGSTSATVVGADPISLNGTLTAVPEPAATLIGSLGLLTLLRRRRY